jgi:two-component system sensor histidine kinase RegB
MISDRRIKIETLLHYRNKLLSLKTITTLRWMAICGQLLAIVFTYGWLKFPLAIIEITAVIILSISLNITASFLWNDAKVPLGAPKFLIFLCLDTILLSLLIGFTGGILNPFVLLMIGPVIMAALVLNRSLLLVHLGTSVLCASLLVVWHYPLPWPESLHFPPLLKFGWWLALTLAIVLTAGYTWLICQESQQLNTALISMGQSLEKERKTAAIGTLAAAFIHELGTPLSTIILVSHELKKHCEDPYIDDFRLLHQEALACQEILKKIGSGELTAHNQPDSYTVLPFQHILSHIIHSLNKPAHITLELSYQSQDPQEPLIRQSVEIEYALKNLLQNALEHAKSTVKINLSWDGERILMRIHDDGPGFCEHALAHFGEPFISGHQTNTNTHLGLGLFIANTLLTYLDAQLSLSNEDGAVCHISWTRNPEYFAPPINP